MDNTTNTRRRKTNYISLAFDLYEDLKKHGIGFDERGMPVLDEKVFLSDVPDDVDLIPATKRHAVREKSKTILCFYENESFLYRHLKNLEGRASKFRDYFGIAGFDLSVCRNDPVPEQRMMMTLNALVTAFFAVRGIRILRSLRSGDWNTLDLLVPRRPGGCYALGLLGCRRTGGTDATALFRARLAVTRPASLVLYATPNLETKRELARFGIPSRSVPDWKTRSIAASTSKRKAG